MAGLYSAPVFRNPEEEIVYLVLTDFAAAFVFVWIYLNLGAHWAGCWLRRDVRILRRSALLVSDVLRDAPAL